MIQKVFHVTWTVFGVVLVVFLTISSIAITKTATTLSEIQTLVESIQREDITRMLNIVEQQLENDRIRAEADHEQWKWLNKGWSPEKWKVFIDYAVRHNYEITDENWQLWLYGLLEEQN